MTQVTEYNTKIMSDADFQQWRSAYDFKTEPPENVQQYIFNQVLQSEQKVEDLYKNLSAST